VDTSKYSTGEHLIVAAGWTPDSGQVAYQLQDREQTWLDLNLGDPNSGATKTLLRETTKAWVARNGPAIWLKDGSFLWPSERTGFQHIFHYAADGSLLKQVTSGRWEADTLYGVDEQTGWIYFMGTEHDPIGRDLYRVKIDGTGFTRLSRSDGTHTAVFNPSFSMYVGTWSDINTPPEVRLHRADGAEVRVIDRNEIPALKDYKLSKPEFVHVKTRDGFVLEAELIKPPDFDPSKKYPVFEHTYSGPHAPQVRNAWGGTSGLYYQLLAQKGIVVWICDNRSASGKGAESAWVAYQRLGETELADLEECLGYLKAQPWIDASRVGLDGWSYGGFMTLMAMFTQPGVFAAGAALRPVTDWANYNDGYTSAILNDPQSDSTAYRRSSPIFHAEGLQGRLLICHGMVDDNVLFYDTVRLTQRLIELGKAGWNVAMYPAERHGFTEISSWQDEYRRIFELFETTLK